MSCCNNPDIKSSTYTDWCENCGWAFSYISGTEGTVGTDHTDDYKEDDNL